MKEPSEKIDTNVTATPPSGKVDINAVRMGLAQVMDGLRTIGMAGAKISRPYRLQNGSLLLPVIIVHDHELGLISVMDGQEMGLAFTIDGISVMDKEAWNEKKEN